MENEQPADPCQPTSPYQSTPILSDTLNSSSQRIRILELDGDKGNVESPLVATLQVQNLQTENVIHQYEALSYVWGKPSGGNEQAHSILIRDGQGGTFDLEITPNLSSALMELRKGHTTRRLWVDAICIDQKSDQEKNNQVPLMATIYSGAKHVCIWIGESQIDTHRAIRQISRLRDPRDFEEIFDEILEEYFGIEDWLALVNFMQRGWFSRRWVIQEVALAKASTLYCGEYRLDWNAFAEAVSLCHILEDRVKDMFPYQSRLHSDRRLKGSIQPGSSSLLGPHVEDTFPRISIVEWDDLNYQYTTPKFIPFRNFNASALIELVDKVVIRDTKGAAVLKKMTLEELVSMLSLFEASCPQDVVYAVTSLASDACEISVSSTVKDMHRNTYPIDYNKPFIEVAEEFLEFVTHKSNCLDVIFRPWVPNSVGNSMTLPSWIRTAKHLPLQKDERGSYKRRNADLLVGMPGKSPYSTSAVGQSCVAWKFHHMESAPVLTARGFVFEKIEALTDKATNGFVPHSWFTFTDYTSDLPTPPQKFWETIVAARDAKGEKAPRWYVGLIKMAYEENSKVYHLESTQRRDMTPRSELMDEYQERISAVVWDRKLMRTDVTQRIGLAPEDSQVGDMICVLYGCSVPVVLRLWKENSKPRYRIIGECYVEGIMDGQAMVERYRSCEAVADESFDIY